MDIWFGPFRDVYLILGAFDRDGRSATLKAQLHPMIAWIWLGGVVVVLGGLMVLWPHRRRVAARVPAPVAVVIAAGADRGP